MVVTRSKVWPERGAHALAYPFDSWACRDSQGGARLWCAVALVANRRMGEWAWERLDGEG